MHSQSPFYLLLFAFLLVLFACSSKQPLPSGPPPEYEVPRSYASNTSASSSPSAVLNPQQSPNSDPTPRNNSIKPYSGDGIPGECINCPIDGCGKEADKRCEKFFKELGKNEKSQ